MRRVPAVGCIRKLDNSAHCVMNLGVPSMPNKLSSLPELPGVLRANRRQKQNVRCPKPLYTRAPEPVLKLVRHVRHERVAPLSAEVLVDDQGVPTSIRFFNLMPVEVLRGCPF